ncbi:hypothetical protein ACFL1U_01005 [Patescibacteria group bacterium]
MLTSVVLIGCSGGSSSTDPGGGGDGTDLGTITELYGDSVQLRLDIEPYAETVFTVLHLFGLNSCSAPLEIEATSQTPFSDGGWTMIFDIPAGVDLSDLWRFNFTDNSGTLWLNEGLCTIHATGVESWGSAFAFSAYVGNEGDCYNLQIEVSGTPTRVVLNLDNGELVNPMYTQINLWVPGARLEVFSMQATSLVNLGDGKWEIVFDLPTEADVVQRWMFGFEDPGSGAWLPISDDVVTSGSIVIYGGNFVFREYCGCVP